MIRGFKHGSLLRCNNISSPTNLRNGSSAFPLQPKKLYCDRVYPIKPKKKKRESVEARMEKLSLSGAIKMADHIEKESQQKTSYDDKYLKSQISDRQNLRMNIYRENQEIEEVDVSELQEGENTRDDHTLYDEKDLMLSHIPEFDMGLAREKLRAKMDKYLKNHPISCMPLDERQRNVWKCKFPWDRTINQFLQQVFGLQELRDFQKTALNLINMNQNVLLSLPTGGGKSLCYQLPAMLERGTTIVISPLISLIEDQVHALRKLGLTAVGLSSQVSIVELKGIYAEMEDPSPYYKFIFITPERMIQSSKFIHALKVLHSNGNLQRFVIDEAHCISEWGHDFRKDYRRLSLLKEEFSSVPIVAMSASCTPSVRKDILEQLKVDKNTFVLQDSFNRKNLWIQIEKKTPDVLQDIYYYVINSGYKESCGIVFALTCSDAERIAEYLSSRGLNASFYHGNLSPSERRERHISWLQGGIHIMCTTIAFGLGINKEDVRFVVHSSMPTSIEAYYQQIGRAGRDLNESDCIMFYSRGDRIRIEKIIRINAVSLFNNQPIEADSYTEEEASIIKEKLDSMDLAVDCEVSAMKTEKLDDMSFFSEEKRVCRKKTLLEYFGEDAPNYCGSCDVCLPGNKRKVRPIKKTSKKLSSQELSGILARLAKSNSKTSRKQETQIEDVVEKHELREIQNISNMDLKLDLTGRLEDKIAAINQQKELRKLNKELKKKSSFSVQTQDTDIDFQAVNKFSKKLYTICDEIAAEKGLRPRNILTHQNIKDIAAKKPTTIKELQAIRGIGMKKSSTYGETIIEIFKSE